MMSLALNNWVQVFLDIFTHPLLIELCYQEFSFEYPVMFMGARITLWYLHHKFNFQKF